MLRGMFGSLAPLFQTPVGYGRPFPQGDAGIEQPQAVPPADINDPRMQFFPEELPPQLYMNPPAISALPINQRQRMMQMFGSFGI